MMNMYCSPLLPVGIQYHEGVHMEIIYNINFFALTYKSHTKNILSAFTVHLALPQCPILVNESQHDDFWRKDQGSEVYGPNMRN